MIISPCSSRTRTAVECNEYIEVSLVCFTLFYVLLFKNQNEAENRKVRDELINTVMSHLRLTFGGAGKPGLT